MFSGRLTAGFKVLMLSAALVSLFITCKGQAISNANQAPVPTVSPSVESGALQNSYAVCQSGAAG